MRLTVALIVDYEVQAAVWKRVRLLRRITGVTKYFTTGVTWRCIRRFVADSLVPRNLVEKALLRHMTGITTGRTCITLRCRRFVAGGLQTMRSARGLPSHQKNVA